MALNLDILPHVKDYYALGEKYFRWSFLFDSLALKSYGIQDLPPKNSAYNETMANKFHYSIMSTDELSVYRTRSGSYDPKNFPLLGR